MIFEHELTKVRISDLSFDKTNPNVMNKEQMAGLRKAMERFGYLSPIVVDQNNQIADGEHRVLMYKEFNIQEIPCYRVTFSDDSERRLLRQTMNKLRGQHDFAMDADEMALLYEANKLPDLSGLIAQNEATLKELMLKYKPDLPFGHEDDEQLDQLIDEQLKKTAPDTQLGDIYQLGSHRLICADCSDRRSIDRLLEGKQVDLTVTSPPYDDLRDYGERGYNFDFETTANELLRITKDGGVVVWVVGDATIDGSETLSSFKQALYFKQIGFRIHDTMIYGKTGLARPATNRYNQSFEYMFILSKQTPKAFNPLLDKPNNWAGNIKSARMRYADGHLGARKTNITIADFGMRSNIWFYDTGWNAAPDKIAFEHPAIFPLELAADHIKSWSNEASNVYDPFLGSGSTLITCEQTGRICYGCEIDPHYCDVIIKRWEGYTGQKAVLLKQ